MSSDDDKDVIAFQLEVAETIEPRSQAAEAYEKPPPTGDRAPPERRPRDRDSGLPEGCPVIPLGVNGDRCLYLDALHQLVELKKEKHGRLSLQGLFGSHIAYLYQTWPRKNADGDTVGWRAEKAGEELMAACARRGIWDVFGRLRGAGGWLGEQGELVLHCGDGIARSKPPGDASTLPVDPSDLHASWSSSPTRPVYEQPGDIGRFVYPAAAAQPRPSEDPARAGEVGPAWWLRALFKTWNFERGELDAHLLLGWLGAAIAGGALKWRPMVWMTGDIGTGKSTLQEVVQFVLDDALISVGDTTAAGIWQKVGYSSVPVALDELEPDADNRKQAGVIQLARKAASGAVTLRGGADHSGQDFVAKSCFLFSSVLIPPLQPADVSRMAILELGALKSATAPALEPDRLRQAGRQLRRRMLDQWPRFHQTLQLYRHAMTEGGHGGRGSDQFGTLLACADLLLFDDVPSSDELAGWKEQLAAAGLAELRDHARDHERCIDHLMTFTADVYRSGRKAETGDYVRRAAGRFRQGESHDRVEPNEVLATYGLRVVWREDRDWLAVANSHQGLAKLYEGTHWAAASGAGGVWSRSLARIEGAQRGVFVRIGSRSHRCVLIPIDRVLPAEDPDE